MARKMTEDEVRAFMTTGSRTGKLATVNPDGSPHVVSIWFDFDSNGDAVFVTQASSRKARNMRHDPRAALLVDTMSMPFDWARIDGTVTFSDDPDDLLHWATETCRRFVGDDLAEQFGRRNAAPGELVVRLTPTSLRGRWAMAD